MKKRIILSLIFISASFNAAAMTQFKPAVLNAALLFEHDATTGNIKHSIQLIRDLDGKIQGEMDVRYDHSGCFTEINVVEKQINRAYHLINKNGIISSSNGQFYSGKVNKNCEITELKNDEGSFVLNYNVRGLLETVVEAQTGNVITRYEYGNNQFPVRIKEFKKGLDNQLSYSYGSEQPMDLELTSLKNGKLYFMMKQSCSYALDGNADKCGLIMSTNKDYKSSRFFWIVSHLNEYYEK